MKKTIFLCLFSVVTLLLVAPPAHATLLIGEDFNYANGQFNGTQNGGFSYDASNAWTSAWAITGSPVGITINNGAAYSNTPVGIEYDAYITRNFTENQAANTTLYFQATFNFLVDSENIYKWYSEFLGGNVQFGIVNDQWYFKLGTDTSTGALPTRPFANPAVVTGEIAFNSSGNETLKIYINGILFDTLSADIGASNLGTVWTAVTVDLLDQNEMYLDNLKLGTDFNFTSNGSSTVPEPSTLLLLGSGLLGLVGYGRKRMNK